MKKTNKNERTFSFKQEGKKEMKMNNNNNKKTRRRVLKNVDNSVRTWMGSSQGSVGIWDVFPHAQKWEVGRHHAAKIRTVAMPKAGKDVGLGGIAFPPSLPPPPYPSCCSLCLHDARNKAYFRWIFFSRHLCFEFGRELRCVRMRGFSTSPKRIREEWSGRLCKGNSFFFVFDLQKDAHLPVCLWFFPLVLLEIWFISFMIHVYSIERDFFHFIPQGPQKMRIYQFVCRIPCPFCW